MESDRHFLFITGANADLATLHGLAYTRRQFNRRQAASRSNLASGDSETSHQAHDSRGEYRVVAPEITTLRGTLPVLFKNPGESLWGWVLTQIEGPASEWTLHPLRRRLHGTAHQSFYTFGLRTRAG